MAESSQRKPAPEVDRYLIPADATDEELQEFCDRVNRAQEEYDRAHPAT